MFWAILARLSMEYFGNEKSILGNSVWKITWRLKMDYVRITLPDTDSRRPIIYNV